MPLSPGIRFAAEGNLSLEMIQMSRVEKRFVVSIAFLSFMLFGDNETTFARQDGQTRVERSETASRAVKVSDGLTIRLIADDDLVPDCTAIATGPGGRLFASGPRYVCELLDQDSDGIYDARRVIVDAPSHGAHGLCVEGDASHHVAKTSIALVFGSQWTSVRDAKTVLFLSVYEAGNRVQAVLLPIQAHSV